MIYDTIGRDWLGEGVAAADVVNWLSALGDEVTDIDVKINSPGGSVWDGFAIYNALSRAPQRVTVHVDGLAASAASVIAMSGDVIIVPESAWLMIHNASALTVGTAEDHEEIAVMLRRWSASMANVYAKRSGMDQESVQALMDAETWMSGEDAISLGFGTKVVEAKAEASSQWGDRGTRLLASFGHAPRRYQENKAPLHVAASASTGKAQGSALPMNEEQLKQLAVALGLPEDAKAETVIAAAESREAPQSKVQELVAEPSLQEWIPRSEFDALASRLQDLEADASESRIDRAISSHKAKIQSPGYEAALRKQLASGSLSFDAFEEIMAATPESRLTKPDSEGDRGVNDVSALELTREEADFCRRRAERIAKGDDAVFAKECRRFAEIKAKKSV